MHFIQNFFLKKNKQTSNCPDNLIYCTTDAIPFNPPIKHLLAYIYFICENHFLPMITCENLFFLSEYFLTMKICENLLNPSCSWESFLIYAHLWEPFLINDHLWESLLSFLIAVLKSIFWGSIFKVHPWDNSAEVHFLRRKLFWFPYSWLLISMAAAPCSHDCWLVWLLLYAFLVKSSPQARLLRSRLVAIKLNMWAEAYVQNDCHPPLGKSSAPIGQSSAPLGLN